MSDHFPDASPSGGEPDVGMVASAVSDLAGRGFFSVVWADDNLLVTNKIGPLAAFVATGEAVSNSIVVLIGQEDRIKSLAANAGDVLNFPNVAFMGRDDEPTRMNVSVCRGAGGSGFLVLLGRVLSADVRDLVLEDEIRKRRIADAELARINARLEEFAYVISHDLKAPLRALRYLLGDVEDALMRKRIDAASARGALAGLKAQVKRMSGMLAGLLEYSRIGRERDAIETVDTGSLADEIIASVGAPPTFAIRRAGEWPNVSTALVPLDVVLRNLIENAVKHHDKPDGLVIVTATRRGDQMLVSVKDDGPGIPAEWHEAIFEPFRRMADEPSSESSGIGLALVRRTVETMGGRVDIRSGAPAQRGSEFLVAWPIAVAPTP